MTTKNSSESPEKSSQEGRSVLRTALLLACSAAFGGLTVALWNRKTLNRMHSRLEEEQFGRVDHETAAVGREDDIY